MGNSELSIAVPTASLVDATTDIINVKVFLGPVFSKLWLVGQELYH